jgi:hypothetical protein
MRSSGRTGSRIHVDDHRNSVNSLLGTPGYAATLVNLPREVAAFNGRLTHPKKVGRHLFRVQTDKADGKAGKVQLQVPGKYLRVVREHALASNFDNAVSDGKSYAVSGSNRSSVELAFESLSNQLRAKMRSYLLKQGVNLRGVKIGDPRTQSGVEALFHEFDGNGDGEISRREFTTKCAKFGIKVSKMEMDLLWPLFDKNGDGSLNVEELLVFVAPKPMQLADWDATKDAKAVVMRRMTSQHRQARIEGKSKLAEHLTRVSVHLREKLKFYMTEHKLSPSEMFERFFPPEVIHRRKVLGEQADNKVLQLTKADFQEGLMVLGINEVGPSEMELIWPMFHSKADRFASKKERMQQKVRAKEEARRKKSKGGGEGGQPITVQEWGRFIRGNSWSRELLFDSFSSRISSHVALLDEQQKQQKQQSLAQAAPGSMPEISDLLTANMHINNAPSYAIVPTTPSSAPSARASSAGSAKPAWGEESTAAPRARPVHAHTKHTSLSECRFRLAMARKERLQRRKGHLWRTSLDPKHTGLDSPACLYRSAHVTSTVFYSR